MKNKLDEWLLLTGKKFGIVVLAWILAVILHNLFYALSEATSINFEIGEVFFFILATLIIPIYFFPFFQVHLV